MTAEAYLDQKVGGGGNLPFVIDFFLPQVENVRKKWGISTIINNITLKAQIFYVFHA